MNRITDTLWISDIDSVRTRPLHRFDFIVTVCQDEVLDHVPEQTGYAHFNMSDGPSNVYGGDCSYGLFEKAARTVETEMRHGTVLVHCHMGQSRSAATCIAALGAHDHRSDDPAAEVYEAARETVAAVRDIHPDPLLVRHALRYITEHT